LKYILSWDKGSGKHTKIICTFTIKLNGLIDGFKGGACAIACNAKNLKWTDRVENDSMTNNAFETMQAVALASFLSIRAFRPEHVIVSWCFAQNF